MPSLTTVIAAFRLRQPTSLGGLRPQLQSIDFNEVPPLYEVQALIGFVSPLVPAAQAAALVLIGAFADSRAALAFADFRRRVIAVQMIQRLVTPDMLNQRNTNFCGPTAFVINLCRQQPGAWIKVLIDLANSGKARLGALEIEPSSGVKGRSPSNIGGLAEADWIYLASLRDKLSNNLASLVQSGILRKSFEEIGISWEAMEEWNRAVGFTSVVTYGTFLGDTFEARCWVRPGATQPRLTLKHQLAMTLASNNTERHWRMLEFAEAATHADWNVFIFVDDKLSRALSGSQVADASWASDQRAARGQLGAVADPAATKARYASVKGILEGADVGGHVFLLLDLQIGGMYVTMTGINRGHVVTSQLLPKAGFSASVCGVIASTDSV